MAGGYMELNGFTIQVHYAIHWSYAMRKPPLLISALSIIFRPAVVYMSVASGEFSKFLDLGIHSMPCVSVVNNLWSRLTVFHCGEITTFRLSVKNQRLADNTRSTFEFLSLDIDEPRDKESPSDASYQHNDLSYRIAHKLGLNNHVRDSPRL
ncbi:uncharacterized protein EAF01_003407 [Botrytis porri]|uniref:uncharacterized protein n=1 Tax=Botrytis porri TaxID=87229 RepID=UPI001902BEBB|nr:uncharacterized protein EAF01_003407 [Botrytis porri]KAF7909689.1 hypothetical protein EAF01_003407 [Botrytis porri]